MSDYPRSIVDAGGRVCGLIEKGDKSRDYMEDCLVDRVKWERPLGGKIERGWWRWVPNQWAEPLDAPVLLYKAEEGENGAFYGTYLDLRR